MRTAGTRGVILLLPRDEIGADENDPVAAAALAVASAAAPVLDLAPGMAPNSWLIRAAKFLPIRPSVGEAEESVGSALGSHPGFSELPTLPRKLVNELATPAIEFPSAEVNPPPAEVDGAAAAAAVGVAYA